jgi:Uma2 family endonuclease
MATIPRSADDREVDYPTSDGRASDSDVHRDLIWALIQTLNGHYAADPMVYVSGNLLLYYERGNKRKRIAPDVFVVRGVPKGDRDYYLLWHEGKSPEIVIEITSKKTRFEDMKKKMALYRDVLQVPEYFLFDPFEEYLKPSMQGYRLANGNYDPIQSIDGRLPSEVLGLQFERVGTQLRLFKPSAGCQLLTFTKRAEAERQRADRAEAEGNRLRQEIEALRRERNGG